MNTQRESTEQRMNFVASESLENLWQSDRRSGFGSLEHSSTEKNPEPFAVPFNIYSHGVRELASPLAD
jgi:hypothetical protein